MAIAAFYQAHQWPHRFTQMYWPNDYSTTVSAGIGKTIQRLEARIKQHIPAYVLKPGKNAKKRQQNRRRKRRTTRRRKRRNARHLTQQLASIWLLTVAASMRMTGSSSQSWLWRGPSQNSIRLKHYSSKCSNQTSTNKKNLSVVYTFSSHTFHTCTHLAKNFTLTLLLSPLPYPH